jgi:catalase
MEPNLQADFQEDKGWCSFSMHNNMGSAGIHLLGMEQTLRFKTESEISEVIQSDPNWNTGSRYYAIDNEWITKWLMNVRINKSENVVDDIHDSEPGPIDNTNLQR